MPIPPSYYIEARERERYRERERKKKKEKKKLEEAAAFSHDVIRDDRLELHLLELVLFGKYSAVSSTYDGVAERWSLD